MADQVARSYQEELYQQAQQSNVREAGILHVNGVTQPLCKTPPDKLRPVCAGGGSP